MAQTVSRMNHIFGTDGKTFILAMDHGSNFNVLPAMKDAKTLIRELAAAGADAFLSTIGMAENFAGSFLGQGIILRIDGGVSFLGDHNAPMQIVATAEDALRLGADSVITMSFPGSVHEAEVLSNLARVCLDCHKWGMPVTAEALPRGFEKAGDSRTPENITFACRQAAELGADIVGIALGKTAGDDDLELRVFLAVGGGLKDLFNGLGLGRFDKGAGIDDHGVRFGEIVGKSISGVLQQSQHFLAVYEVFRAAERDHGHRGGIVHGVSFPDK